MTVKAELHGDGRLLVRNAALLPQRRNSANANIAADSIRLEADLVENCLAGIGVPIFTATARKNAAR